MPNFIAASAELKAAADTIGQVLWEDLRFEREYDLIPRASYAPITPATSMETVPFAQWKELGANAVLIGTVRQNASSLTVQARLFDVATQRSVWAKEYTASASNPRSFAHTISDELHKEQRSLAGVARTKLAFASDRDGEQARGTVEQRSIKEIYIADYDGESQRRVTVNRSLAINPSWAADGRAIAYTSYRRGYPDIYVSYIYQGKMDQPAGGTEIIHNFLPAFSPDGTQTRVHDQPRRQHGDLLGQSRRLEPAPRDASPRQRLDADVVAGRQPDRVHVGSIGLAADLHRRCRRDGPAATHHQRILGRPRDLVAGALQRDRLCRSQRPRASTSRSSASSRGRSVP